MIYITPTRLNIMPRAIAECIDVDKKPEEWENYANINCYAYALGLDIPEQELGECAYQPGVMGSLISKKEIIDIKQMSIEERMFRDLKALEIKYKVTTPETVCFSITDKKDGVARESTTYSWPIALFESEDGQSFHFLRKTQDGTWYHKLGYDPLTRPSNLDVNKKIITDPRECDFGDWKYKKTYQLRYTQKW